MTLEKFAELAQMMERCVSHSQLKNGHLVSIVHVNMPALGGLHHMLQLERRVVAEVNASNEETAASWLLARQLEYLLEFGNSVTQPIYQQSEDGDMIQVGKSEIYLDRTRLKFPTLQKYFEDGQLYADCVVYV